MTILDVKAMIDMERFRKINVRAQSAADVYANVDLSPQSNLDFLKRCIRWIPVINFADYETGQLYTRLEGGRWVWHDKPRFDKALDDPDTKAGLLAVARTVDNPACSAEQKYADVTTEKIHTLGAWGAAAPVA